MVTNRLGRFVRMHVVVIRTVVTGLRVGRLAVVNHAPVTQHNGALYQILQLAHLV